ncbi:MAG: response regulator transcription factor [Chloroflexi bacterium]|nr:response regulator transcription factor [Chloroflexota bacterium]
MKILLVEDDPEVGETVSMAFSMRWPDTLVQRSETGKEAIAAVAKGGLDLVILDVNLPDMDGFTILDSIRKRSKVPVIMLTVRASDRDKVRGLEMGADDYLGKPFSPFELLARAAAVLRRAASSSQVQEASVLAAGVIKLNQDTAEVFVADQPVKLSPTEFKMLELLVQNAGKVVTRDTLIKNIWGMDPAAADAYLIKLHIQHLRKKMGDNGVQPKFIITVRGFGYKVPA